MRLRRICASLSRRPARSVCKYLPVHVIVLGGGFGLAANNPWSDLIALLIPAGLLLLACSLLTVGRTRGAQAIRDLCAGTTMQRNAQLHGFPVAPIVEGAAIRA